MGKLLQQSQYFDTVGWATGRVSGILGCKETGCWFVGGDILIGAFVTTTSIILSSNKIQNGDIPVLVNAGPPGKWPLHHTEIVTLLSIFYVHNYFICLTL